MIDQMSSNVMSRNKQYMAGPRNSSFDNYGIYLFIFSFNQYKLMKIILGNIMVNLASKNQEYANYIPCKNIKFLVFIWNLLCFKQIA